MAHNGRFAEEWELDVAEDRFENVGEDVQWVEGSRLEFSAEDTNARDEAYDDWRRQRGMMSPLEGAQREAQMEEKSFAESDETPVVAEESRNGTNTTRTDINSRRSRRTGTGGDQFQAMDDVSGDGETYYYDEDLTRNGQFRDRTASNADLIFRTPQLIDRSRMKTLLRYIIIAVVAFGVGTIFGVLLDLITSSCPMEQFTTIVTTTTNTNTPGTTR